MRGSHFLGEAEQSLVWLFDRKYATVLLKQKLRKVLEKLKKEAEEKGLKLSITEGSKEGKSKGTASCTYLEGKLRECREGLENKSEARSQENEGNGTKEQEHQRMTGSGREESRRIL